MANIKDIARRSGYSTATVSHVLNNTRPTRPATRQRVMAAAHALGYAQNQAARSLALGRSTLLGLIVSDIRNPFFPEIIASFQEQALLHSMDALILNTNYDGHRTLDSVRRLIGLQVPAVAVMTSEIDPTVIEMLTRRGVAAVYLDLGRVDRLVSNIALDYENGIAEALEYLTRLGHRRIAYIGGPAHLHSARRRQLAFQEKAAAQGLDPELIIEADFTVQGGYFACGKLLQAHAPTAILAANDLTALGVLHRAYEANRRVPADLSVIGFDDIQMAEYTQPALSTVTVARSEIGRVAFQALWNFLDSTRPTGTEFRIGTRLLVRGSTAAL